MAHYYRLTWLKTEFNNLLKIIPAMPNFEPISAYDPDFG